VEKQKGNSMKTEATKMSLSNVNKTLARSLGSVTKIAVGATVAMASVSAFSAGLTDGVNNGVGFGRTLMNGGLIIAACAGAILVALGAWSLRPGQQQSQNTPGQSWGKIAVGVLLVNTLWLITESSKEFTNQESSTFNESVSSGGA
jgi:hypothetical protein